MEALRQILNRELFLGLEEYESHFALYAPGAFYRAHLDRFRDDDKRTVSVVLYLNDDWLPEHGGALRLHPQGGAQRGYRAGSGPHGHVPVGRDAARGAADGARAPVDRRLVPPPRVMKSGAQSSSI